MLCQLSYPGMLVTGRASTTRGFVNLTVSILFEHLAGRFELPRHLRSVAGSSAAAAIEGEKADDLGEGI